jgi:adenylosuccinate lyase
MKDYSEYMSPFSWRYGSSEMRVLWSEKHKRELWRKIWVSLARVESGFGLVTKEQVDQMESKVHAIDIERSLAIEDEIKHDLMAEIKTYAEQCPLAGGIIHLGATSMDIEDNADALRLRESLECIIEKLKILLGICADRIEEFASVPIMAFTHIQPAEPTTLGYRFAVWAQDILLSYNEIKSSLTSLKGKGFKRAVGTSASYHELFGSEGLESFDSAMSKELQLEFFPIATQTSTRIQEYRILSALATLGAALHKMAFDLRILQSPPIGEVSEPFGKKQVGSSAMPFKRNPITAEKIDSLARLLSTYPLVAWSNASLSLLERTLDDSANRRSILPEAFLASDEILVSAIKIVRGLVTDFNAMKRTFDLYAPFACTERVMMAMAKSGADRQETHERLREHALVSWTSMREGRGNPLLERLVADSFFSKKLGEKTLLDLMQGDAYVGDAPERARAFASCLRSPVLD